MEGEEKRAIEAFLKHRQRQSGTRATACENLGGSAGAVITCTGYFLESWGFISLKPIYIENVEAFGRTEGKRWWINDTKLKRQSRNTIKEG